MRTGRDGFEGMRVFRRFRLRGERSYVGWCWWEGLVLRVRERGVGRRFDRVGEAVRGIVGEVFFLSVILF